MLTSWSIRALAFALLLSLSLEMLLANAAHAAPRLYTGSLIIETFGNNTTTGAVPPSSTPTVLGIPLAGRCNTLPYHAPETIMFPIYPYPSGVFTLTIPKYGGAERTIDTNSDTVPDLVPGCGKATLAVGNPLTGSGTLSTTGASNTARTSMDPRAISIPLGALSRVTSASASPYGVDLFELHYVDLKNQTGLFSKGGGDGDFSVVHTGIAGTRRAVQSAGKNRFGGVMRLLGSQIAVEGYLYNNMTFSVAEVDWLFDYLGAGGQATDRGGSVTAGHKISGVNYRYTVISGYPLTSTFYAEVFKWTTGTVKVTALEGIFPTILEQGGYDSRTVMGNGVIQLVSPMLTRWVGVRKASTAGIGVLTLTLVPEPSGLAMSGAGMSMLALLYHARRRAKW